VFKANSFLAVVIDNAALEQASSNDSFCSIKYFRTVNFVFVSNFHIDIFFLFLFYLYSSIAYINIIATI
jgi:hypothetical protein